MALKRPTSLFDILSPLRAFTCLQCRRLHRMNQPAIQILPPTPFVPDAQTFLTLIGRKMSQHAAKIPSWEALFTLTSAQLKEAGVEPARARKYLLWWRHRYQNGIVGIGGDLREVKDGVAELRIVEVPSDRGVDRVATLTKSPGMRKVIVNVEPTVALPPDPAAAAPAAEETDDREEVRTLASAPTVKVEVEGAKPVVGVKIVQSNTIGGTGIEAVKGYQGVARLKVKEGLWEQRRGYKVDGGERRKAEVRYKRRAQERKMAR